MGKRNNGPVVEVPDEEAAPPPPDFADNHERAAKYWRAEAELYEETIANMRKVSTPALAEFINCMLNATRALRAHRGC